MSSSSLWSALVGCALVLVGCDRPEEVVVYVSVDQVYAEPILRDWEVAHGLAVSAIYDTEATKTTGLASRILAEREAPQADVFWNSEIVRTLVLEREGVLEPYFSPAAEGIGKPKELASPTNRYQLRG